MQIRSKKARIRVPIGGVVDYTRISATYEGASLKKSRMGLKGLGSRGPNANVAQLPILRSRVRHALINNPYAGTAQRNYVDNVVGTGITPQWPTAELQDLWDKWAKKCDADGQNSFYGLQALAASAEFSDGEVIARLRWRRPEDNLPVPFQIELMEGDHLPEALNDQNKNLWMGIEKNGIGQRVKYHLHPFHPLDHVNIIENEPKAVDASEVIHMYSPTRPKQDRGFPALSSILVRLYEIDEMQDATLAKQKTASLFGLFVTRSEDEDFDDADDGTDEAIIGDDVGEDEDGTMLTELRPGGIHYLDKGEKAEFSAPEGVGSNYVEWLKTELRASAKAVGMTYEQMTGDLTGVNFSSLRAGLNEFRKRIERVQYHVIIHQFCNRTAEWFLDAVFLNQLAALPGYIKDPQKYLPTWQTPKLYSVNPLQDAMTDVIENRAGYKTRAQCQAERGHSPDAINKRLVEEQGVTTVEELILDSNPSVVNKTGTAQAFLEQEQLNTTD